MLRSQNKAFQAERTASSEILGPAKQAWRVQGTEPPPAWLELSDGGGRPGEAGSLTRQGKESEIYSKWEVQGSERPKRAENIFKSSFWFLQ